MNFYSDLTRRLLILIKFVFYWQFTHPLYFSLATNWNCFHSCSNGLFSESHPVTIGVLNRPLIRLSTYNCGLGIGDYTPDTLRTESHILQASICRPEKVPTCLINHID